MLRSRLSKTISIAGVLLLVHIAGLTLRNSYGILIDIANETKTPLSEATVTVMGLDQKNVYMAGSPAPGKKTRLFVTAKTESHVDLEFLDPAGQHHRELIVGYVEHGYCGRVAVRILPNYTVKSDEKIDPVACWRGWFDF